MNLAVYIVAVLVVATGIYFSQKEKVNKGYEISEQEEVLSESDEELNTDNVTPTSSPEPTVIPTPVQSSFTSNISDFKYPNSQIISSSSNSLSLESSDNSDSITEWYKDKINSFGMNVKTFVKTKANDKVLNKLVGADGQKELSVEISKENTSSSVDIFVTIIEK